MSRKRKGNIGNDDMDDYDSSFDDDEEEDEKHDTKLAKRSRRSDLTNKAPAPNIVPEGSTKSLPTKEYFQRELTRAESYRNRYFALNAYERHRKLINDYFLYHPGAVDKVLKRDASNDRRDIDIIKANHKFLWDDDDEADTWEKQLAKRYYDKLFKEYCICDLSRYKENKVAMRWRTETELVDGKGQFSCGARKCTANQSLRTWEVNFAYMEDSTKKNALVKLRLCPECSTKLNFGHQRKEVKKTSKHSSSSSKRNKDRQSRGKSSKHKSPSRRSPQPGSVSNDKYATTSGAQQEQEQANKSPENIWKEPLAVPEAKSREEEFEDYLDDLFV